MANARPEVHVPLSSGGSGPPPPGEIDYFAPKYLVGNVPAGDSAVAHSAGGFIYIPDPGDGTGIQTALGLAAITVGDVWARPGTYDFELGAVNGALTIPIGVRFQGAGVGATIIQSRSTGDQGAFILSAGASVLDCTITAPAATAQGGTQRGLLSIGAGGCLLRRLQLSSAPNSTGALRSLISLVAGGGGSSFSIDVEDIAYSVGGNVTSVDPTSALEVVPGLGAVTARVTQFAGVGGDTAFYDPSVVSQGINQLIGTRLTLSGWLYASISWTGVGVLTTLAIDSDAPNAAAAAIRIACRPGVPSTVLRDVYIDPKGTITTGISLLADVNGGVGQAPVVDGVTWSGNAAVSAALVNVASATARGLVIRKVFGTNNISLVGINIKGSNPDATVEDCTIELLGTSGHQGIISSSVRSKIRGNTVSLLASGAGGVGTAIAVSGAQSSVQDNNVVTANAADVGVDLNTTADYANCIGNVLDMNTDANAFVNVPVTANVAQNVVV